MKMMQSKRKSPSWWAFVPSLILGAVLVGAVLVPSVAFAQPRIAYVTSWRIIGPEAEFQGSRDAEQALNRDVESWNRELEEKKQAILALEKEIEQKRLLISESKRQELEQKRTQLAGEYERRVKEVYGDGGLVERRNFELTKSILDKVKEAVTAIAREDGYDFVFDASDANLVWANKQYDITERVLTKMAEIAGAPAGGAAAPPVTPPVNPNPNPGGQR
jgi:outer membrane protein